MNKTSLIILCTLIGIGAGICGFMAYSGYYVVWSEERGYELRNPNSNPLKGRIKSQHCFVDKYLSPGQQKCYYEYYD